MANACATRILTALIIGALSALPARAATIRVLTYNIHHAEGTDGKIDPNRIADVIRAENPDVVCLQEVDRNMTRTGGMDMPALLAARLGMNVAFGPNLEIQGGHYGNATLTHIQSSNSKTTACRTLKMARLGVACELPIAVGEQKVLSSTHTGRLLPENASTRRPQSSNCCLQSGLCWLETSMRPTTTKACSFC